MKELAIIIPVRFGDNPDTTLRSLAKQTYQDFDVIVSYQQDDSKGVNFYRNRGADLHRHKLLLFSDADISWKPNALERLRNRLINTSSASYSYGAYEMDGKVQCNIEFDAVKMRRMNFVSTMSMIRAEHFPGFDEDILRLTDWALWRKMLQNNHMGVYVGEGLIFTTKVRDGITFNGPVTWTEAYNKVIERYGA